MAIRLPLVPVQIRGYRSRERGHLAGINASETLALPGFTFKREQLQGNRENCG